MKLHLLPAREPVELTLFDVDPDTGLIQSAVPPIYMREIDPSLALYLADMMRGPPGPTPNIAIDVTLIPAGDPPGVVQGGTPEAPTFDIQLPEAPTGNGFGAIKYQATGLSIALAAGTQTQLEFAPVTEADDLKIPFVGHDFWDGALVRAANLKDVFMMKMTLGISPLLIGGLIDFVVTPYLGTVPNEDQRAFAVNAGDTQTITISYPIIAQQPFMDNGGLILLKSSVPAIVREASLSFYPWSVA